jgi:shikimate kinase
MGVKHAGKSTIGRILAAKRGMDFIDLDEEILGMERGKFSSVRELWNARGGERFRILDEAASAFVAARLSAASRPTVVALGGYTGSHAAAIAHLRGLGIVVYLDVDPEILFERIARSGIPPFLDRADPAASFMKLHELRAAGMKRIADVVVPIRGEDAADAADLVARAASIT